MNRYLIVTSLMLAAALPASAQFGPSKVATVTAAAKSATVKRGSQGVLLVTVHIGAKYHINAHTPNDPAYIPTVFTGSVTPGITFGPAQYPSVKTVKVSYSPKPLLVYRGNAVIAVPFTVARSARPGAVSLRGSVAYQGCDAQSCYPPMAAPVVATVIVR